MASLTIVTVENVHISHYILANTRKKRKNSQYLFIGL